MNSEPAPEPILLPTILKQNQRIGDRIWLAGVGSRRARIVFVTVGVLEEEAREEKMIGYGRSIPRNPRMLDCAHGVIFRDLALRNGIDLDKCFYVPVLRYLPEDRKSRLSPKKSMLDECLPLFKADMEAIKPDIIVCVGKKAFDVIADFKAKEDEIFGAWFYSKEYDCKFYPMKSITDTLKPELHERYCMDFQAIKTMLDATNGIIVPKIPTDYKVVRNSDELRELVMMLKASNKTKLAVDCEWEGQQHVDGQLRSMQICWDVGEGAYIRFMDENLNYVFDVSYAEAGEILGEWLNTPEVKYIGHHLMADLAWMSYWLKLEWYNKGMFDTEFAMQCVDEASDLGLDTLALKYTDLGKYDWDLLWYRKTHPERRGNGYGLVPDEIIIPYAIKDVDATFRSYLVLEKELERQNLTRYYNNILLPFVTDVFTSFCLQGLPVDKPRIDEMRELFAWAKIELEKEFRKAVTEESEVILMAQLMQDFGVDGLATYHKIRQLTFEGTPNLAEKELYALVGAAKRMAYTPIFDHYLAAPTFNIRSKPQMVRWLFKVKPYIPVRSTANKSAGIPAVSWEKILAYPPAKQATFTPATDNDTLEILASKYKDPIISQLLELNSVATVCRSFLREPIRNPDTGEIVKEQGLHFYIASDNAIHLQHSCTETGRARSWSPNVLNWASWIHTQLGRGMLRIINLRASQAQLPPQFSKFIGVKAKDLPTIRSIIQAPPDWCIVEADYQTAEMRGLAYLSGDSCLIAMIEDPDPCFALVKPEHIPEDVDAEDCVCRISFPDFIELPANKNDYLMTCTINGVVKATFTEDQLLTENGVLVHHKFDMHWNVVEFSRKTCREVLDKKKDRGAGKTTGFSNSYGGQANSIARKIEANTGTAISPDEVQQMMDAIEATRPVATAFLKAMEKMPETHTHITAASGRRRHCHTLAKGITGLSARTRDGQLSAIGRECRNYLLQESVASTAARACIWALGFSRAGKAYGLRGYSGVCLYDSLVVFCPIEERAVWIKALRLYMWASNAWQYGTRTLRYPIDTELNGGWSTKAPKELHQNLHNPEWQPTPDSLKPLENWLDLELRKFESNPELAVSITLAQVGINNN